MDHKSDQELRQEIEEAEKLITIGAKYVHYKNSENTYTVLDFVIIQSLQEVGVLYHANYGGNFTFVRSVSKWLETVDGQPRFKKI